MTFVYKANLKMDDQYRIENPLGFQVTDYRVDADASTAAPDEVPDVTPAAAAGQLSPAPASVAASASTASAPQVIQPSLPSQPPIPEHEAPRVAAPGATAPNNTANGVGHR